MTRVAPGREVLPGELQAQFGKINPPEGITFRHISQIVAERREPEWLLEDVIERNVLAVLAGPRGSLKSFIAIDWAMQIAMNGHPGLLLSAEGDGLDRRIDAWMRQHRESSDLTEVPLLAHEKALNLNDGLVLAEVRDAVAAMQERPALIVIDTFSKYSAGIDENDNGQVAAFLAGISSALRDEFRCAVLLVAHTGHGDAKRPRGASVLMTNPDAEYIVSRPDPTGMLVTVSRDRFKDTPALPPLAYEAKVVDLMREDRRGRQVTSLALVRTDAPPPSNAKGRGRNQEKLLSALTEWIRSHPDSRHLSSIDFTELCRAQRIDRKRQREVADSFVNARILTPATGGYALHPENL